MELSQLLENKDEVKKIAKYLYGEISMREAVQLGKRVDYFRGKKLYEVIVKNSADEKLRKKYHVLALAALGNAPEDAAKKIGIALIKHGYLLPSKVKDKVKRELEPVLYPPNKEPEFSEEGYYTWLTQFASYKRNFLTGLLIAGFLSMVMFPVWPMSIKVGVWYVSVTILLVFSITILVRNVLYLALWIMGIEFWIFPNLFDDDASVIDSFRPIYSFEFGENTKEEWIMRAFTAFVLIGGGVWVWNQPTEFDEILVIQRQFVQDLYDGKLLSDSSENKQESSFAKMPDLDVLKRELEEDGKDEVDDLMEKLSAEDDAQEEL